MSSASSQPQNEESSSAQKHDVNCEVLSDDDKFLRDDSTRPNLLNDTPTLTISTATATATTAAVNNPSSDQEPDLMGVVEEPVKTTTNASGTDTAIATANADPDESTGNIRHSISTSSARPLPADTPTTTQEEEATIIFLNPAPNERGITEHHSGEDVAGSRSIGIPTPSPSRYIMERLESLGYEAQEAAKALEVTGEDINQAIDYLTMDPEARKVFVTNSSSTRRSFEDSDSSAILRRIENLEDRNSANQTSTQYDSQPGFVEVDSTDILVEMGYNRYEARLALAAVNGDMDRAVEVLMNRDSSRTSTIQELTEEPSLGATCIAVTEEDTDGVWDEENHPSTDSVEQGDSSSQNQLTQPISMSLEDEQVTATVNLVEETDDTSQVIVPEFTSDQATASAPSIRLEQMLVMGFAPVQAVEALSVANGDLHQAIAYLNVSDTPRHDFAVNIQCRENPLDATPQNGVRIVKIVGAVAVIIAVVLVAVAVVVFLRDDDDTPPPLPDAQPPSFNSSIGTRHPLEIVISLFFPTESFPASEEQEMALQWLMEEDPASLSGYENRILILQRFILSLFFNAAIDQSRRNPRADSWTSSASVCDWYGIQCEDVPRPLVVTQMLDDAFFGTPLRLDGSIPSEIGLLTALTQLALSSRRNLIGTLPTELGRLTELQFLLLNRNGLTGTIPTELGNLSQLKILFLNGNSLSGEIPTQFGRLTTELEFANFQKNKLVGPVPSELGKMTNLVKLQLQCNDLDSILPPDIDRLVNTTILSGDEEC